MAKVKVKGHKRADGTKVKGHTREVSGVKKTHKRRVHKRKQHTEMSESRAKRVGRQIKRGLTRLMRKARSQ